MPHCASSDCQTWRPQPFVRLARVGVRVDGDWFCSTACVESTAETRLRTADVAFETAPRPPIRLGALLVHAGSITSAQLKEAVQSQSSSGLRIGAELRRLRRGGAAGANILALGRRRVKNVMGSMCPYLFPRG